MQKKDPKVIVALDYADKASALSFVEKVSPGQCKLKVGKEMFTRFGPDFVSSLINDGFDVFLDLKFHDIPATVAKACSAASDLGVWMMNVHAQGGVRMMQAAKEALEKQQSASKLIAVTVLTSMDQSDLNSLGIDKAPAELAKSLALLTNECELDGIVCSAQEAEMMRKSISEEFLLVTPGIRPAGSVADDQRRIMTPVDAMKSGASYLVIGRPITQSDNPSDVLMTINSELSDFN